MGTLVQSSAAVEFQGDAASKDLSLTGVTSGNSILVCVALTPFSATEPVLTVSDGSAYTEDVVIWYSAASNERKKIGIYRLHNVAAGSKTITVSFTGPSFAFVYGAAAAYEVSGLENFSADRTVTGSGNSDSPISAATGAMTQADNFVIGVMSSQYSGIDTPSGYTNLYLDDATSGVPPNSHDYVNIASASSLTIGWGTLAVAGDWACVGAVYKDATVVTPQFFQYRWPHQLHARL